MDGWPPVSEPDLAARQRMSNEEFLVHWNGLIEAVGTRVLDDRHYERAITYPWERPEGSCLVSADGVQDLDQLDEEPREEVLARYTDPASDRIALLAYGANGSPGRLALKLAHLPPEHRDALVLAGWLEGFDVGVVSLPPVWITMAGTPITSPGTEVRTSLLYLTEPQFTALWWTEMSYLVGALSGIAFRADLLSAPVERVLLFVNRFGAFCVDGEPLAMGALPARNRRWRAMSQEEILEVAACLVLGEGSTARDLIKAAYENPAEFMAAHYAEFDAVALPFESPRWGALP